MPFKYLVGRMCSAFIMLALLVGGAGCTAMKTVKPQTDPSRPRFGSVKAGDSIVLQLRDGRRLEITVARMEAEAVVSAAGVRYPHADIVLMQKRSFSGLNTLALAGAVYRGAAAAVAIALSLLL
jgi:hypothetical protein